MNINILKQNYQMERDQTEKTEIWKGDGKQHRGSFTE